MTEAEIKTRIRNALECLTPQQAMEALYRWIDEQQSPRTSESASRENN